MIAWPLLWLLLHKPQDGTMSSIIALAKIAIFAYWMWRWERESNARDKAFWAAAAEHNRRFEEINRANTESRRRLREAMQKSEESRQDSDQGFEVRIEACRESTRLLKEALERFKAATPPAIRQLKSCGRPLGRPLQPSASFTGMNPPRLTGSDTRMITHLSRSSCSNQHVTFNDKWHDYFGSNCHR